MKTKIKELIDSEVARFGHFLKETQFFSNKEYYTAWCAQTYYYTLHTCEFLERAGKAVQNKAAKEAFLSHVSEEKGHENLAKLDYKNITGGEVINFPEFQATKDFWEYIDYKIDEDPISLFGYALSLEFLAADIGELAIHQAKGHGEKCYCFLKEHYEVDQSHTKKMMAILDYLNESELNVVYEITKENFETYMCMLEGCMEYASIKRSA